MSSNTGICYQNYFVPVKNSYRPFKQQTVCPVTPSLSSSCGAYSEYISICVQRKNSAIVKTFIKIQILSRHTYQKVSSSFNSILHCSPSASHIANAMTPLLVLHWSQFSLRLTEQPAASVISFGYLVIEFYTSVIFL